MGGEPAAACRPHAAGGAGEDKRGASGGRSERQRQPLPAATLPTGGIGRWPDKIRCVNHDAGSFGRFALARSGRTGRAAADVGNAARPRDLSSPRQIERRVRPRTRSVASPCHRTLARDYRSPKSGSLICSFIRSHSSASLSTVSGCSAARFVVSPRSPARSNSSHSLSGWRPLRTSFQSPSR